MMLKTSNNLLITTNWYARKYDRATTSQLLLFSFFLNNNQVYIVYWNWRLFCIFVCYCIYRLCIHSTRLINTPHEPRLCSLSLLPILLCIFFVMQIYLLLNIIQYLFYVWISVALKQYSQLHFSLHLIRPEQALVSRRLVTQVKTIDWFACRRRYR